MEICVSSCGKGVAQDGTEELEFLLLLKLLLLFLLLHHFCDRLWAQRYSVGLVVVCTAEASTVVA